MSRDDDNFRIRPGKVRDRGSARPPRPVRRRANTFMGEVHQAIRRAGGNLKRGTGKASGRFTRDILEIPSAIAAIVRRFVRSTRRPRRNRFPR